MIVEARPEELGFSTQRLQRLGPWMDNWVDSGRLPGAMTAVLRRDRVVYSELRGLADVESGRSLTADSIFRIYSMSKPITTLAAMMLYEEGHFQLDDPLSRFLPSFADMRVYTGGAPNGYQSEPARRQITPRDLMVHTAGLTYGFLEETPVDALYRAQSIALPGATESLESLVERLAELPLLFHPGERWNYSVASDVLGCLVQVISGMPFEDFLKTRIFEPLGMTDTGFFVPADKLPRFCANYIRGHEGELVIADSASADSRFAKPPAAPSGGGGLVSTLADYIQFARLFAGRGECDGVRLLGRKTVELMTMNHLSGDLASVGTHGYCETTYQGFGFGLGFSVLLDPAKAQIIGSPGEFAWGGMASTCFWIDPLEDLIVVFLTQLMPSDAYPLRRELRTLVYQALVD